MEMTPAKLAFIKGQETKEAKRTTVEAPAAKLPVENAAEAPSATNTAKPTESRSLASRRTSRSRTTQATPEASDLLDQVLVPVTVRLPHRMAQALRPAHLEQRLKQAKPDTQQEIVEEALGDWLFRQGYL